MNGWMDHVHVFFELPGYNGSIRPDAYGKGTSSKWINDNKFIKGKFSWQEGYGAFSYSRSQRDVVIQYITKQEEHHKNQTFKQEYLDLLKKFEIPFEDKYVFEFYD